jgi:hypothetical protein
MGRPGSALDNAVIESWHSTVEFELRRIEHFATRAAARARVAAWIEEYNTTRRHSACGMMPPVAWELAARRVSAAGRCAAQIRKEAVSPPLTFSPAAAPGLGDAPREGTGPPLRPQGCSASPAATASAGPALTPETTAAPQAGNTGRPSLPRPRRGASGEPVPGTQADTRNQR